VALDAMLYSQRTSQFPGTGGSGLSSRGSALAMRSEVLPGLQLNVSRNSSHSEIGGRVSDASTTYADLLARLDARNTLSLTLSPSRASVAGSPSADQKAYRVSWTSQLTPETDLLLSLDRYLNSGSAFSSRTFTKYLTLRFRPDLQTTLALSLLWDTLESDSLGSATSQQVRSLDTDLSWLPTRDVTLGLHFSLQRLTGEAATRIKVPGLDLRWQLDSKSDFSLSWRLQDQTQPQVDALSLLQFTTLTARFSQRLSGGSQLAASYDVVRYSQGQLAYQRRLGLSITTGLGR
jgi:hypothetical protein